MGAPLDQFLFILFRGPLRSASLLTIRGPLRSSVCILLLHVYGALSNQFLVYYIGAPQISLLYGGPPDQFFHLLNGAPQVSFCAYYMGPPHADQFLWILHVYGGPSGQFLRLL